MSKLLKKVFSVLINARYVKQQFKRGLIAQGLDILKLYRLNPTCNISDYYVYKLFAEARGSALYKELLGFSGHEAFSRSLNARTAVTPAWDKMVFEVVCKAYNLQTPELLAVYKPAGLIPGFVPAKICDAKELKDFLVQYGAPVFVKPVKGSLGQGAFYVAEVAENGELVIDKNGNAISFDAFCKRTIGLTGAKHYNAESGVLLQKPIVQHPLITEFTQNDSPSGFRILVINTGKGPYIHRVIWKVVVPGNISDNFDKGGYGNMLVQVNPTTGKLSGAVSSYWPKAKFYSQHPISGRDFSSFTLPLWEQVTAEVLRAAGAINGMGAMHWDVVITEKGAVFLELNDIGGTDILQLHGKGLMDDDLKIALRQKPSVQKGSTFARFINK
ncbi:sugar-transfer associated ATP-grasp domain-containing protein [Arsukibacterium sp.]|uniref:sugar-transfer associated ATP-grasp domain-containing protein n=1 Tax=Arsukibacterium sp. TaxID=1977258 RepID=UPI001BD3D4C5|nr:sugar-transfer associated ATP-grasp domain-containing protein [Arsukibacterium sp.]